MHKVRILYLAADAHSIQAGTQRLRLDEEVRRIREAVRASGAPDVLAFDHLLAARTGDLLRALQDTRPHVVHFSGHGRIEGLYLVGPEGTAPHLVPAEALAALFRRHRGEIRVVVLNACFSLPQAEAIAQVVGCAIGTRREISDDAAITFAAEFYRALACGDSVQSAFDQAHLAVSLDHFEERDCPVLVARRDVDPARIVLAPKPLPSWHRRLVPRRVRVATGACLLGAAAGMTDVVCPDALPEPSVMDVECGMRRSGSPSMDAAPAPPSDPSSAEAIFEAARTLYGERKFAQAAAAFERAANAGDSGAMACLGDIYFHGRPSASRPLLKLFHGQRGVERNAILGLGWLREAASDERDATGMYALAVAYLSDGTPSNDYQARYWFTQAAREKEYAEAMRRVGALDQAAARYAEALASFRKAVDSGSVDARVDLGLMHEQGLGTAPDSAEAFRWYASARSSPRGMWAIGRAYELGIGVRVDPAQAVAWYRRAAAAGSADAMRALASLYERGAGVRRNWFHARCWRERAAQAAAGYAAAPRTES